MNITNLINANRTEVARYIKAGNGVTVTAVTRNRDCIGGAQFKVKAPAGQLEHLQSIGFSIIPLVGGVEHLVAIRRDTWNAFIG